MIGSNLLTSDPTLVGTGAGWSSLGTTQPLALDKRRLLAQILLNRGMGQPNGANPNAMGAALQGFTGGISPLLSLLRR